VVTLGADQRAQRRGGGVEQGALEVHARDDTT
jgi:hypothetical protein